MIALLDDVSVLHNEDQICILDRGKSVCDNETGSSLHQIIHRFLDLHFCSCIDGGCCFVKDQDLVVRKDRPRDRKKLFLSLHPVPSGIRPAAA